MRGDAMTTHYIDLRVVPDPETGAPQLMGVLFNKLHQVLVQLGTNDIGVSFPQYSLNLKGLGSVLRLHGAEAALKRLSQLDCLKGMRDHVRMTEVSVTPAGVAHCLVMRKQFKTNAVRLRRRRMKRKGETYEQAAKAIPDNVERKPNLPLDRKSTRLNSSHVAIS